MTTEGKVSPLPWKSGKRYVIEGVWSGYRSSQERAVHRAVTTRRALVEWCAKTFGIVFTDGTTLYLTVRPALPREKVHPIHGYDSLISDCAHHGVSSVAKLHSIRDERAAALAAAKEGK